ncbi:hypothetical protein DVH05_015516 [Phytophthora capsici]|nr:hypothetical protein DVH05_018452 [Phytophthora capsici]KAG1698033.1 hypothetical protein DVH05_015516 [Phytophthora capsici]
MYLIEDHQLPQCSDSSLRFITRLMEERKFEASSACELCRIQYVPVSEAALRSLYFYSSTSHSLLVVPQSLKRAGTLVLGLFSSLLIIQLFLPEAGFRLSRRLRDPERVEPQ